MERCLYLFYLFLFHANTPFLFGLVQKMPEIFVVKIQIIIILCIPVWIFNHAAAQSHKKQEGKELHRVCFAHSRWFCLGWFDLFISFFFFNFLFLHELLIALCTILLALQYTKTPISSIPLFHWYTAIMRTLFVLLCFAISLLWFSVRWIYTHREVRESVRFDANKQTEQHTISQNVTDEWVRERTELHI